ncbi:MAG TPA: lipid-binding SYLF domain-containing protein [Gammaproteobacteria bacterium]|nr:lipid-binding SYLF domain-containing protein [Gammaproteobacteria bacterium]
MKLQSTLKTLSVAIATASLLGAGSALANDSGSQSSAKQPEASKIAQSAANVLRNQMQQPASKRIPRTIVDDARCIGVFPSVLKAGFVVGGSHGDGVVSCRNGSGKWSTSAPAYFELSSGSVGFQAGAQSSELIMVFMTKRSARDLTSGKLKLGADIGVAAGPAGLHGKVNTAPAPVLTYRMDQEGAFAGAELKGAVISADQDTNRQVYGQQANASELLFNSHGVPGPAKPFDEALEKFAPAQAYNTSINVKHPNRSAYE